MKLRPLVLDEAADELIGLLKKHAEENPFDTNEIMGIMCGDAPAAGDRNGFSCDFHRGYRAVFTYERHPGGWSRHISVSVDTPGKMPNSTAVDVIMEKFGFKHKIGDGPAIEDGKLAIYQEDDNDPPAINVIEFLNDDEIEQLGFPKEAPEDVN